MKRLIFLLLCLVSSGAFASAPTDTTVWIVEGRDYPTLGTACNAYAAKIGQPVSGTVAPSTCKVGDGGWIVANLPTAIRKVCWNGSPPDTSKPLDKQCPDQCPLEGTSGGSVDVTMGWRTGPDVNAPFAVSYPRPGSVCMNGCMYELPRAENCMGETGGAVNGYYRTYCSFSSSSLNAPCEGGDTDPNEGKDPPATPPTEPNRCPNGTKQTGVDSSGIPICAGNPPETPPPKKTTTTTKTTNPDGSVTETTTEKTTNSDGSETTKTTTKTTSPDGMVTNGGETTTTGNKPDGTPGKYDSSPEDRADLCKRNPLLTICRNSQISGTCESVSCDGDAIQCAIAREVAARNCRDKEAEQAIKEAAETKLGQAVLAGNDPLANQLPKKDNAQQVNIGGLAANGWLGGGSCFSDKQFVVQGRSITIPFSAACDYLVAFRYVVMLIALISSFKILSGAILRS